MEGTSQQHSWRTQLRVPLDHGPGILCEARTTTTCTSRPLSLDFKLPRPSKFPRVWTQVGNSYVPLFCRDPGSSHFHVSSTRSRPSSTFLCPFVSNPVHGSTSSFKWSLLCLSTVLPLWSERVTTVRGGERLGSRLEQTTLVVVWTRHREKLFTPLSGSLLFTEQVLVCRPCSPRPGSRSR